MKRRIRATLEAADFEKALEELLVLPLRSLCSPLISFLASGDGRIKWRAVAALGAVVARLAGEDIEAARNIVRRLNWSLTEEAGAIGWGAPEAIGEILARHDGLANEYAAVLLSYASEINLLDHPPLLCGALWGIARLAGARPELLRDKGAVAIVTAHLESDDSAVREMARHALARITPDEEGSPSTPSNS